ncbi:RNA-guided endonuclease InsQ/TnpB family protein [Lentzea sp. NPDC055074]
MLARYRYRIEPTVVQRDVLARTFGCARVVFNDAIHCREAARRAGEKISPAEVQRRVITEAKLNADRVWLHDVASVALVQSVRDADRAYRNFFESLAKRRKGRPAGRPRLKSRKDSRQSFRLTRNGFVLRPDGSLYLAKVGDVRVRWSRALPSEPSSVTVIREPDGHYYASFVVDVDPTPFPPTDAEAGIDLGITRFAVVAGAEGQFLDLPNPRHFVRLLSRLARLDREKHRRLKGSSNREKTRRKLAVLHGRAARARRDHHHKLALTLVRDNQVVYVEDLNIAGMLANRSLAIAISDAGWAQFIQLLREKAERHGRTVHAVSRWLPSSKTCSSCGHLMTTMPLGTRTWTCPGCRTRHDRDHNAALNILAAGQAERRNARGAQVSPPL